MTTTLGINGFGRIGRGILRALLARGGDDLRVVAINDPAPTATLAHLLEFDSVHGRLGHRVEVEGECIEPGTGPIRMSHLERPEALNWADVDIALECTGRFTAPPDASRHLRNGSDKVLLSAPAKGEMKAIVVGVNDNTITADDVILSNASCTTNGLAPLVHRLDEAFGVVRGHMTTVHSYTGNQPLHDAPHDDLHRGRAAGLSMIPTTTGAARTMGLILPHLKGAITGTAIRVPAPNVSCIDLVVELRRPMTPQDINDEMARAALQMPSVFGLTDRPLVSIDFNHDPRSLIFATDQTSVQQGTLARVLAWYDNEWGFSNRMLDVATLMGRAR
ncbi:type I glyceraldehyde-3-phosphate dehydrogenase [Sulfitobacter sp. S190]|uniref:type I glyceraldehyde-3-phosphate dehydrogenase n=1 Tax=Sulfitobacter sp. S190 TaxID=2867022 RepID=UPI0021A484C3|nr:type I glyceraldehyde-3-phosphate dehydrogenase [Sulfitobacter sp. S190]UWR21006.1 glyceraldehyde-3-phosphate dehydrogenase [Sulfitobacter sp. S190]